MSGVCTTGSHCVPEVLLLPHCSSPRGFLPFFRLLFARGKLHPNHGPEDDQAAHGKVDGERLHPQQNGKQAAEESLRGEQNARLRGTGVLLRRSLQKIAQAGTEQPEINDGRQAKVPVDRFDGMQIRDWLYVMDHCKAIDMVANGGKDGEVYNVGGHNERPNIFIVKTVIEQLHDRLKDEGISEELIKHVADRLGHDRRYGIDPTKIKNDLGWYPETPFEKGIVLTIDWYLNHQEWMDHVTSGDYQNYYQDMYKNK